MKPRAGVTVSSCLVHFMRTTGMKTFELSVDNDMKNRIKLHTSLKKKDCRHTWGFISD